LSGRSVFSSIEVLNRFGLIVGLAIIVVNCCTKINPIPILTN
jgi:hypothetical protein